MPERLLTVDEVCQLLRLSRSTIYRMADEGRIPKISLGRKIVRFREADIADLIGDGTKQPA